MSRRRRRLALLTLLGSVVALLLLGFATSSLKRDREGSSAVVTTPHPVARRLSKGQSTDAERSVTAGAHGARARATTDTPARMRPSTPLDDYLSSAMYPPSSRPIAAGDRSLIDYAERHERPRPAEGAGEFELLFTADRAWLSAAEQHLLVVLAAWERGKPARVEDATVTLSAKGLEPRIVALESEASWPPAHRATLDALRARFGRSGPMLAASVSVSELGLETPTTLRLDAEVELGGATVSRHLLVPFTPEASTPARFTGRFDDDVEGGSLLVRAEVEVQFPGYYLIDANLHEVEGRPLAWTRWKGELSVGRTFVPLRFFGKVLRDSDARAPFEVSELRGALHLRGQEPHLARMPTFEGRYRTRDYSVEQFSDKPWESPKKQAVAAKLAELDRRADSPFVLLPGRD